MHIICKQCHKCLYYGIAAPINCDERCQDINALMDIEYKNTTDINIIRIIDNIRNQKL